MATDQQANQSEKLLLCESCISMKKLGLLTIIVLAAGYAHGFCQMSLSAVNTAVNLNANDLPTLDLRVEKLSGDCSTFFITIDNGGAASFANRALKAGENLQSIQFYKDAGRTKILKDEFETSFGEVLSGSFAVNSANTQNFVYYPFLNIPANKYSKVGSYSGNFTLKLFSGTPTDKTLIDSKIINFQYEQKRAVEISLVNTGAPFDFASSARVLNFGTLTKGATLAADLVLTYNAGYAISISSLNGGRLKHAAKESFVPYALKINGVEKSVSDVPSIIKNANGVSPEGGARLPIQVKIGDLSKAAPGNYSDIISITVASYE